MGSEQPQRTNVLDYIRTVGTQFVIPVYQRNYTWNEKKEVKQLLDDYSSLIYEDKKHFLGIIMYLSNVRGFNFRENIIIDGQQRLTTIFLMLNAIRELAFLDEKKDIVVNIDEIINNKGVDDALKMKLKPLVSDDDVYRLIASANYDFLNSKDSKQKYSRSRVYINYQYIKDYFKKLFEKHGYTEVLNALIKLNVVVIPIGDDDNAQQVFESINAAGVPLKATDLIRNFILMDLNSDIQDYIHLHYWDPIEKLFLGSNKFEDFFRAYLSVKNYNLCNKKDIYSDFKKKWINDDRDTESKLQEIYNYADHFTHLYLNETNSKMPLEIKENRMLNLLTPAPLLLEMLELKREEFITESDVLNVINTVNIYFIRRDLASCENNVISRLFPSLLKRIMEYCDGDYSNIVEVVKMFLINYNMNNKAYMPDDITIKNNLKNINAYSKPNLEMILHKVENIDNTVKIEYNTLSKEHIMPQKPTEYWSIASGNIPDEEYSRYVNMIGNLTLVSKIDNSSMGNKDFETKKEHLRQSKHIKMNEAVIECDDWTIQRIEERTDKLINLINTAFPYSKSALTMENELEIYLCKGGADASGIFNKEGKVTININSECKVKRGSKYVCTDLFTSLYSDGIIEEINNKFIFVKEYTFSSLNEASSVVVPEYDNPEMHWVDSSGITIKEVLNSFNIKKSESKK